MQNELPFLARRFGSLGVLTATIIGLGGCVPPPPPPVIIAAPPPPAVVYRGAPPVRTVPAQPAAPVQTAPAQPTSVTPVQPRRPARALSDGQVVGILAAANNAEIREAQLALRISRDPRVRGFAQRMISDHSRLNNRLLSLANRLGIVPAQSPARQHLLQTEQQALRTLSTLRGRRFDRTYIRHQVATHRTVLNGLNRILLPSTRQPSLRTALSRSRPVIADHLRHAQDLQAVL